MAQEDNSLLVPKRVRMWLGKNHYSEDKFAASAGLVTGDGGNVDRSSECQPGTPHSTPCPLELWCHSKEMEVKGEFLNS